VKYFAHNSLDEFSMHCITILFKHGFPNPSFVGGRDKAKVINLRRTPNGQKIALCLNYWKLD
jgi:hypothetical protein